MYEGFNPQTNTDIIVISEINNTNNKYCPKYYEYYNYLKMKKEKNKENPNKSEEEINAEILEEIKRKTNKLKVESLQRDFKIDNEKTKELESTFKQIKLKIIFDSKPKLLRDGKFYTISNGILSIYDNRFFYKLHEIEIDKYFGYTSVIKLDNEDLILFSEKVLTI